MGHPNPKVAEAADRIADHLDAIRKNFKDGALVTLAVRFDGLPDQDFILTTDQIDRVIEMLERRKVDPSTQFGKV